MVHGEEHKKDRQYELYFKAGLDQTKGKKKILSGIVPGKIMFTPALVLLLGTGGLALILLRVKRRDVPYNTARATGTE